MSTEKPIAERHSTVIASANQLLPVLAEMDHLQHRHVDLLRKSQKLTDRVLMLARAQCREWSDTRQSELVRLDANANSLQLKLASTQRGMNRLRRRFETALAKFRTAFVNHDIQLTDLQIGNGRVQRQNAALDRSLRYLIRTMSQQLPEDTEFTGYEVPEESHEYIPIGVPYYLDMLCRLDGMLTLDPDYSDAEKRYRPVSFLEVGAGSGRNMMLAKSSEILLCNSVHGFDINPDQIAEGEQMFDLKGSLEVADALDFDYGGYDVIFSYRPFSDLSMQEKLEARMADTMLPSTYFVAPLSYDLSLYPELMPMDGRNDIWKKTG